MSYEYNLDDNWIKEFENMDKYYKDFYKDDLYYVNLTIIYVNRENEIDKIKHEPFLMTKPNNITHEEMIKILKYNSTDNSKRYSLLSILKYNITLEPEDVKFYLQHGCEQSYLSVIKNIDAITFNKTISMFHDLNDLILIYYEKSCEYKKSDSITKKIYLRSLSTNKKTIKNRYKDYN